ncbi:hypothetical protein ColLi_05144 [Colletotrichum liriopes]|uniref:Uncharacterized protein n=1 Tax=Colletotrichum liriopes TaxID=708192 RepID=A0AA37GJR4_9PEZI|nr:hypothetical protein ColLi_05144 [Colletotrichum liriopes]
MQSSNGNFNPTCGSPVDHHSISDGGTLCWSAPAGRDHTTTWDCKSYTSLNALACPTCAPLDDTPASRRTSAVSPLRPQAPDDAVAFADPAGAPGDLGAVAVAAPVVPLLVTEGRSWVSSKRRRTLPRTPHGACGVKQWKRNRLPVANKAQISTLQVGTRQWRREGGGGNIQHEECK